MKDAGAVHEFEIVAATSGDLAALARVERDPVKPWSEAMFAEELSRPQARIDVCRTLPDRDIVAFCNYWIVTDEIQLLRIVTSAGARRRGHARRLMGHLTAVARMRGCRIILLEVRRSNEAAIGLYRSCGFHTVGVRTAYYADNQEDALLMNLVIDGSG